MLLLLIRNNKYKNSIALKFLCTHQGCKIHSFMVCSSYDYTKQNENNIDCTEIQIEHNLKYSNVLRNDKNVISR